MRECGDHFAAHVAAALVRRGQRRPEQADEHLARARELVTADHPWAYLIPDDRLWNEELQPRLEEDEPGRVYRVIAETRSAPDAVFGNRGVGRFMRMRSGELLYLNPVPLTDAIVEQVRALGEVTHVIAPAKYHSECVPQALAQFPKARAFGVPSQRGYPNVAHVPFAGYLDDDKPLFPDELDQITIDGVDVGDVWFVDRATRTLIVTDAVFFAQLDPNETAPYFSAFGAFYSWAWGVADRVGLPSYQPAMWQDITAYQASLRRAFGYDFDHVASCHGSWRCVRDDARNKLARELDWLLALSRLQALGLLGDFVRRHPVVFWRLIKEQIAMRRARA
jgi:hypothetical protein